MPAELYIVDGKLALLTNPAVGLVVAGEIDRCCEFWQAFDCATDVALCYFVEATDVVEDQLYSGSNFDPIVYFAPPDALMLGELAEDLVEEEECIIPVPCSCPGGLAASYTVTGRVVRMDSIAGLIYDCTFTIVVTEVSACNWQALGTMSGPYSDCAFFEIFGQITLNTTEPCTWDLFVAVNEGGGDNGCTGTKETGVTPAGVYSDCEGTLGTSTYTYSDLLVT